MASLGTHFTSFIFLFPLGIRRLLSSFSLYIQNPSLYRSKTWYFSDPRWKNVDFYILLIALPIASFSYIFLFLAFSGKPTYRFSFLQQSLVISLFWVLLILIAIKENLDPLTIPEHFVFVFAGISFLIDYSMNGNGIIGFGEAEYSLLGGLTLSCAACCFYLSIRPSAYFADFLLSLGLLLKGTWVLQVGLSLYTDAFAFKGCNRISISPAQRRTDVKCDLEEDRLRGVALMNLLFIGHAIMVFIVSFIALGLLSHNSKMRPGEGSLLAQLESDRMLMHPLPEFEIE